MSSTKQVSYSQAVPRYQNGETVQSDVSVTITRTGTRLQLSITTDGSVTGVESTVTLSMRTADLRDSNFEKFYGNLAYNGAFLQAAALRAVYALKEKSAPDDVLELLKN